MTGPDNSTPAGNGGAAYSADSAGGVTTVTHSSAFPTATPFSDDSPNSPYGKADSDTAGATSTWTGSPYEPLPSESAAGEYPSSPFNSFTDSTPTYVAPPSDARTVRPVGSGKRTKQRAIAGLVSAILGTLMVAGGLYLIGEFGFRIFDVMLNVGGQPATWDIIWTSTGAGLIFIAVLLNGWSPWATLVPGLALTAAGVWSIAWYDGADRVASTIDRLFARPEMVVWGITGWMLVLGLMLLATSGAVIIARATGRRRGRP
jgi:hypothetical protein